MSCYFIYNNLKVHPFILGDGPLPGFELISWDSWTIGTLWNIGEDAGYTRIGKDKVYGQLWKVEDYKELPFLEQCCGLESGRNEIIEVDLVVPIDDLINDNISASTFALKNISNDYTIISDGKWRF